jgi:hypothetical protein
MDKLPPIKFALEKPVSGKFLFSNCLSGESKDREGKDFTWNLYKFEDSNGKEQAFFASKGLHATLATKGDLQNKKFTITKIISRDDAGNLKEDKQGRAINEFKVEMDVVAPKVEEKEVDMSEIPF